MTPSGSGHAPTTVEASHQPRQDDGPFVLQSLLDDVPLAAEGPNQDIKINCVDYWEHNLYVGTSASELLHFVQIPPDPNDKAGKPVYILASRLNPTPTDPNGAPAGSQPGVQQILLLPRIGKACILCNWTVSFYSLPELSPVDKPVKNCNWIGGLDLNEPIHEASPGEAGDVILLLSTNQRIQVVRAVEEGRAQAVKKIAQGGTTLFIRRGTIACVADGSTYSLLDIEQQLRIPLMSISSLDDDTPQEDPGPVHTVPVEGGGGISRSASSAGARPSAVSQSHSRSTSLGGAGLGNIRRQDASEDGESAAFQRTSSPLAKPSSPRPTGDSSLAPPPGDKSLPDVPSRGGTPAQGADSKAKPSAAFLRPHIVSPTPEEFLVVIGKSPREPGIGMFVNLDGDATRPPLEFARYPKDLVVDGVTADMLASRPDLTAEEEGYALASMTQEFDDGLHNGLEIQPLIMSDDGPKKYWLEAEGVEKSSVYGVRSLVGSEETSFEDIVKRICQRRFTPFSTTVEGSTVSLKSADSRTALSMERLTKEKELFDRDSDSGESLPDNWEATRNAEEEDFVRRLSRTQARLAVWSGACIWWAVRNPLILQMDSKIDAACPEPYDFSETSNKRAIFSLLGSIRNRDARSELEFMTIGYLQQKAGIILLIHLLSAGGQEEWNDAELSALEDVLVESKLDARVVLSLVPGVRNEIIEGRRGIWIYGGVKAAALAYLSSEKFEKTAKNAVSSLEPRVLHFLRRFLTSWRKMKGFGSVADENEVFRTVDAALLVVLLELDQHSPKGLNKGGAVRTELYDLVDKGVDCFDRAADLLESYHRLFVLSRLYQSRKLAGDVLATWRRIIEGERDDGQELEDGEKRVREYLPRLNNQALIREYGVWLANRNPKLGVQVFAEDRGRAPKFEPTEVVEILKKEAPDAVKYYLEHLVFGMGSTAYVNDLIAYYLDVVVNDLSSSELKRDNIMATYDAYRALEPPKPTYRHFLEDNTLPDDEVWQSRLRLLQLLGGGQDYDAGAIRERLASLPGDLLVPETIILAGRERKHEDALRLLVHKLGDYDTAVSYCLRGGYTTDLTPDGRHLSDSIPTTTATIEEQSRLFHVVLREFLTIEDVSDRVEQTGRLLERFGSWFEVDEVLAMIPDGWSVDVIAGFLVGALRRLVAERRESSMRRALSGTENLRVAYELVLEIEEKGPRIEAEN
ncbi:hypothetical protein NLU13_1606 [Sarocladium strictum]|uniref:CNH domain-containing protein n=1 Tax=Sarocladium strictum TaxID=5046 RepID=A0AA39GR99_SARSR|nr:hypothetical protein NLU13_1606 [Sarocladium strictum]